MSSIQAVDVDPPPDRLAAAYLLLGGRGCDGRATVGRWLAAWAVDDRDRVELTATDGKISIAQVREFQRQTLLLPIAGGHRIGIVYGAQQLSAEAGHAFLKLLEDPPSHVCILLVAEKEDQVLPTIVSRCQRWRFREAAQPRSLEDPRFRVASLMAKSLPELFELAEAWAKSDAFREIFDQMLGDARELMRHNRLPGQCVERLLHLRGLAETLAAPRLLAEITLLQVWRPQ